jgi:mannuronan 5-epimerase
MLFDHFRKIISRRIHMLSKFMILSSFILAICTIFLLSLLSLALPIYSSSSPSSNQIKESSSSDSCIMYDSEENTITVNCGSVNLTDIDNQLNNPNILHKENYDDVWLLNANIVVDEDGTLYINSTDTSWLRIAADEKTAYEIHVLGGLKIDSVKISSWIQIQMVTFFGGNKNLLAGNNIHHNFRGFYSEDLGGDMNIEDNYIHSNYQYGLDPHTGTYDMIIRNNTVYDNGAIGIIC